MMSKNKNKATGIAMAGVVSIAVIVGVLIVPAMFTSPMLKSFATTAPPYTNVTGASVKPSSDPSVFYGNLTAGGNIPLAADSYINGTAAFGYVWLDSGTSTKNAVIAMIHTKPLVVDNAASWHVHIATVYTMQVCTGTGLGIPLAALTNPTKSTVSISNNVMTVQTTNATLTSSTFSSAKAFQIVILPIGEFCLGSP